MKYPICALSALAFSLTACSSASNPIVTSADGITIAYDVYGDSGPALVLVHGWSNNRLFWDPHIPNLSRDYRVVTIDLGGHGESGTERSSWTMKKFGQDVTAVVTALDLRDTFLVGFSMGGAAVLEAASAMPERVAGVVFVDVFSTPGKHYSEEYIEGWSTNVGAAWNDSKAMSAFIAPNAPDSLGDKLLTLLPATPPDRWWDAISNFFRWSNTDLTRLLQGIDMPVAAINAESSGTDLEALQEYAPSFSVKTMPDVGHIGVIWMKLDLFDRLLNETISDMMLMHGSP